MGRKLVERSAAREGVREQLKNSAILVMLYHPNLHSNQTVFAVFIAGIGIQTSFSVGGCQKSLKI
jgi:hypothetical protein